MGKRLIQQRRGKGGHVYRVRRKGFQNKIKYPMKEGESEILKIFHSAGHTAPLMKMKVGKEIFINPAFDGAFEGQKIMIGGKDIAPGNILMLKDVPTGTEVFNIEKNPGDGGKMMRAGGSACTVHKVYDHNKISVLTPKKKEVKISGDCRVSIGRVAGGGRVLKPILQAGRKYHNMKARGKLWPRTSAVCMNAIDHPFGSGRGKRIKSKIAKRNAPPGRKVGHIRPKKTGRKR